MATYEEVVAPTVESLQAILAADAGQHPVVYDTDTVAQNVCFLHRVSC